MTDTRKFGDFRAAMAMRDVIKRFAEEAVERLRPPSFTAEVIEVRSAERAVYVKSVGATEDDAPLRIKYSQDRVPMTTGCIVEISGTPGNYYVNRILAGPWTTLNQVMPGDHDWVPIGGTEIPFQNGAESYPGGEVLYPGRVGRFNGTVFFEGLVQLSGMTGSGTMFTLPNWARPEFYQVKTVKANNTNIRNTGSAGSHSHSVPAHSTTTGGSHTHSVSSQNTGAASTGTAHTHSVPAHTATSTNSTHSHTIDALSTGNEPSHNHTYAADPDMQILIYPDGQVYASSGGTRTFAYLYFEYRGKPIAV